MVVFLEDEDQWMSLLGGVRRPLGDAREEDYKHLLDALCVKETFGHLQFLDHEFDNLVDKFTVLPLLKPLLVMIFFELLSKEGPKSSQDRLVECVDLD